MIDLRALYKRDHGICGICFERVFPRFNGPPSDPDAPTRDHIHPKSLGGSGASSNLRLAHRRCNSERGNGGTTTEREQAVKPSALRKRLEEEHARRTHRKELQRKLSAVRPSEWTEEYEAEVRRMLAGGVRTPK